jgi:hypothetical protein
MKTYALAAVAGLWIHVAAAGGADLPAQSSPGSMADVSPSAVVTTNEAEAACAIAADHPRRYSLPRNLEASLFPGSGTAARWPEPLAQWGQRCYTPWGWCWLPGPAPLGYPCTCCCPVGYGYVGL